MPVLSMRHLEGQPQKQSKAIHKQLRDKPFADEALRTAWKHFIESHPTEHVLINTMRAAMPVPAECQPDAATTPDGLFTARTYDVIVENPIQVAEVNDRMQEILALINDELQNDHIIFNVRAHEGPSSPQTWNEHQVLESMVTNHPDFALFIDALKLTQY